MNTTATPQIPSEFQKLYATLKLPKAGQAYVERASEGPSRLTKSKGGNVSGRYPSRKGWRTKQFESHKVELAAVVEYEYDTEVIAYFDQPDPIRLIYPNKTRKNFSVLHTPDFLVVRKHEIAIEEWKEEAELERLAENWPTRYVRVERGKWRCPPGEEYAAKHGMQYYLRSSASINWNLQTNLNYLEDYHRPKTTIVAGRRVTEPIKVDEELASCIVDLVKKSQGITFSELRTQVEAARNDKGDRLGQVSDTINILIVQGRLYVDLLNERLTPEYQHRTHIFLSKEAALAYTYIPVKSPWDNYNPPSMLSLKLGQLLSWDGRGWKIINRGQKETWLQSNDGHISKFPNETFEELVHKGTIQAIVSEAPRAMSAEGERIYLSADKKALQAATENFQIILPALLGQKLPVLDASAARKRRRLLERFRAAEKLYGSGFVGLIPGWSNCGSTMCKSGENVQFLMEKYAEVYESPKGQTKKSVWRMLESECESLGLPAPAYNTFTEYLNERPLYKQERARTGAKGAYDLEPEYWELEQTTPKHGSMPFDIAHIDHTEAEIELIAYRGSHGRERVVLGRVWITFMLESYSRRLLALYCTYSKPSYRSNMMVIRECVRRHGRLPQTIVVDKGKDFQSTYFDVLLARYEVIKKTRPSKPRYGSVIERLFGTSNIQFFRNLRGNTHLMHHPRTVTKDVNPKELAVWTLPDLYPQLCEWAYEVYDTIVHPSLGTTPRDQFLAGLEAAGDREHKMVAYDSAFILDTLPSTPKEYAHVKHGKMKVNYLFYSHKDMHLPGVHDTDVPVKYDPFDISVAYAYIAGRWVKCRSEHYVTFQGRSEKEIEIASHKLRERQKLFNKSASITAKKLGDFLCSLEGKEAVLLEQMRERETRKAQIHLMYAGEGEDRDEPDESALFTSTDMNSDEVGSGLEKSEVRVMQPGRANKADGAQSSKVPDRSKMRLVKER